MTATRDVVGPTGTSASTIRSIYDVGNEFWQLWLDRTMAYSCALWHEGDDLDAAQVRKLDFLAGQAAAPGRARVLDVGCGWGGMVSRLVEHHGVGRAVGLTLSHEQAAWIRAKGDERVEVRIEDWQRHRPERRYGAIVSSGAFEHFARSDQTAAEKVEAYRSFFVWCAGVLDDGGRIALQTSAKTNKKLTRDSIVNARFIFDEIFPESEVPRLSDIALASQGSFDIVAVRDDRDDYARTAAAWRANLHARREAIEAIVGPEGFATYDRYLQAVESQFAGGFLALLRLTLARV